VIDLEEMIEEIEILMIEEEIIDLKEHKINLQTKFNKKVEL
jgi:hypothetical protein